MGVESSAMPRSPACRCTVSRLPLSTLMPLARQDRRRRAGAARAAEPQRPQPPLPLGLDRRRVAICEPLLSAPAWLAGRGGRPSRYCMRDIVDGIRYLTHNGPVWRALPTDFPPAWTVYWRAAKWQADGSTQAMHDQLRERVCRLAGRKPVPTAAVIDSQSVRAAEEVARAGRGYDAGKKVNGRKRHIAVDTIGLLLTVLVTAARYPACRHL